MHHASTRIDTVERSRVAMEAATLAREGATRAKLSNSRARGDPDRHGYPCGAPPCRIYQPSPSVMQSGRFRRRAWVLEFEPRSPRRIEPLMGWTASEDPFAQIRLTFANRASAVDYAERQGLDYEVVDPPGSRSGRRQHSDVNPEPEQTRRHAPTAMAPQHDCLELMMMQC